MQDAIILYENGKAIGGEGHPTNASDITFDNSGTDLVSENVEDAIKEVNAKTSGLIRMTKLWENPSPTASFSGQTITLSSDDYDFLMVLYLSNGGIQSNTVNKGQVINLVGEATRGGTNVTIYERAISYTTDTQLAVGSGLSQTNGSARATDNTVCVPQTIYGIKII